MRMAGAAGSSSSSSPPSPSQQVPSSLSLLRPPSLSTMVKHPATTWLSWNDEEQKESGMSTAEGRTSRVQASLGADDSESKATEPVPAPLAQVPVVSTSNARRRRTYGQPRVSDDHKRERNRETFRRFYQRKQQTLRELREQEELLTSQYEQLKLSQSDKSASAARDRPNASLVDLITYKDRLSAEQVVLQHVAQGQHKNRRQLGRLVDAFHDDDAEHERVDRVQEDVLQPPDSRDDDPRLQEGMRALSEIQFSPETSQRDDAFGWQCWWQQQGEYVAFRLSKLFLALTLSPEMAARRTWHFYSDPKLTGATEPSPSRVAPSSLVRMRRRVLSTTQDAGRRTRLVYRRLTRVHLETTRRPAESSPTVYRPLRMTKSVYLVTLTELEGTGGFAVVSHSVPNQETFEPVDGDILDALDDTGHARSSEQLLEHDSDLDVLVGAAPREIVEEWIRELCWWRVQPSPAGVEATLAGFAPVCLALSPSACFMEVLRLAVQWEHAVLGESPISGPILFGSSTEH